MTLAHLHLLLNHVPTVGTVIAVALLILSIVRKDDGLRRVSLEVFCVIALLTLPAYLSGVGTKLEIERLPGVSLAAIDRHHDAALLASVFMMLNGFASWLGLWQLRRVSRLSRGNVSVLLLLSIVTLAVMSQAANIGGEIRHPEILAGLGAPATEAPTASTSGWLTAAAVGVLVSDSIWLWPASETLHFIGLGLLFGIVSMTNLRMLGLMKSASFASLHRLLPWAVLGLFLNLVTGMLFVIGTPDQYMTNISFLWKMGLLILAAANLLYMTAFDGPWSVGAGDNAPLRVKALALSSIALWVGVMYFGRMLPFIGDAF